MLEPVALLTEDSLLHQSSGLGTGDRLVVLRADRLPSSRRHTAGVFDNTVNEVRVSAVCEITVIAGDRLLSSGKRLVSTLGTNRQQLVHLPVEQSRSQDIPVALPRKRTDGTRRHILEVLSDGGEIGALLTDHYRFEITVLLELPLQPELLVAGPRLAFRTSTDVSSVNRLSQ